MRSYDKHRPYRKEYIKRPWEIKPAGGGMTYNFYGYGKSLCTDGISPLFAGRPEDIPIASDRILLKMNCRYQFCSRCFAYVEDEEWDNLTPGIIYPCKVETRIAPCGYTPITAKDKHCIYIKGIASEERIDQIKKVLKITKKDAGEEYRRISSKVNDEVERDRFLKNSPPKVSVRRKGVPQTFNQLMASDKKFKEIIEKRIKYGSFKKKKKKQKHSSDEEYVNAVLLNMRHLFNRKVFAKFQRGEINSIELLIRGGYVGEQHPKAPLKTKILRDEQNQMKKKSQR